MEFAVIAYFEHIHGYSVRIVIKDSNLLYGNVISILRMNKFVI